MKKVDPCGKPKDPDVSQELVNQGWKETECWTPIFQVAIRIIMLLCVCWMSDWRLEALGDVPYHYFNYIQNIQCLIIQRERLSLKISLIVRINTVYRPWTSNSIELPLCKEYGGEMIQCPEAKCIPANSSQSSGFIEFGDNSAPHVFSCRRSASHYSPARRSRTCRYCFTCLLFLSISETREFLELV